MDGFLYFLPGFWAAASILTVLFLSLRFSAAGGLLSGALWYVPASFLHPPGDLRPSWLSAYPRALKLSVPMWLRGLGLCCQHQRHDVSLKHL